MSKRTKRSVGLIAVAGMAMLVLTACLNVTYKLSVNSDATLSGTLQAQISRQAAILLGITSADQLNEAITTGDLKDSVNANVAQQCKVEEDSTNFTVNCIVDRVQASEIDDAWSLTKEGNTLTLHVVSEGEGNSEDSLMPEMDMGNFSFIAEFPGPISSVTGAGAVKTNANTVKVDGSLNDTIDFTAVGSAEGGGSTTNVWIFVILGVAVLVVLAIILLVLRKPKNSGTAEVAIVEGALDAETDGVSEDR